MELIATIWWGPLLRLCVPFVKSVVTLGAALLATAVIATLTVGIRLNPWYGFALFLVYVTSLLVLFGYLLAVSPNDKLRRPEHVLTTLFLVTFAAIALPNTGVTLATPKSPNTSFPDIVTLIYYDYNAPIYWFVGIILFITLILVVSLCYKSPQPLRGFLQR